MNVNSNVIMKTFHFYSENIIRDHNYIGVRNSYSCDNSSTQTDLIMSDKGVLNQSV